MMENKQRVIDSINSDVQFIDTFLKKAEESKSEYWYEAYRQQLAIYQGKIDILEVIGYSVVCDDLSYRVIDIIKIEKSKKK